jgi:hypothetical protein
MNSKEFMTAISGPSNHEKATKVKSNSLENIKSRLGEISYMGAKIVALGNVDQIVPESSGKEIWSGAISLDQRIADSEIDRNELSRASEILSESYIKTIKDAPVRCIHAGQKLGYDSDKVSDFQRPLGPQFPAGNVGLAIVHGIVEVGRGSVVNSSLFETGFDAAAEATEKLGYTIGNHQGEHATEEKTGCGAVDGAKDILKIFLNEKRAKAAQSITEELLTAAFGENKYLMKASREVFDDAKFIATEKDAYLPSKKDMLALIQTANKSGAPKLDNNANTAFLVINAEPGTTLHTDEFDAKTDNRSKAFSLDLWNVVDVAKTCYEKENDQQRFIAASVAWSVMAAMTLTDGSLNLLARMPDTI